jgi:tripartite-type tricarboxylate transporter receptor subunit TctC
MIANVFEGNTMMFQRREFLGSAAAVAATAAAPRFARAQAYPSRPVHLVVYFPAGGVGDIMARLIGQWLSEHLGQTVIVENRPGASGNIGTEAVARAPADGYTLLWATSPNAINATLYEKLNYNFIRDIAPVAAAVRVPNVMVVNPSVPAKTVPEFIAYAKANPSKLNMASGGVGVPSHVAGELFQMMAGIKMLHVPYRGSAPAMTDLLAGQVQVLFDALPTSLGYIRSGKLRALAVTTARPSDVLPGVPTVAEFLPGFEASTWFGVGAPKATPPEIVDKLNNVINAGLADPKIKARIIDLGGTILPGTPADFGKLIADETAKWAKVIKFSGAKVE